LLETTEIEVIFDSLTSVIEGFFVRNSEAIVFNLPSDREPLRFNELLSSSSSSSSFSSSSSTTTLHFRVLYTNNN